MKTTIYAVYRVGSNAANQSMCNRAVLGFYDGTGRTALDRIKDACAKAREDHTVYNNQYLDAVPASSISAEEAEAAFEESIIKG